MRKILWFSIRDFRNSMSVRQLGIFQKILFLLWGTIVFDWKITGILPILTQKTALLLRPSLVTFQVSTSVFDWHAPAFWLRKRPAGDFSAKFLPVLTPKTTSASNAWCRMLNTRCHCEAWEAGRDNLTKTDSCIRIKDSNIGFNRT